MLTILLLQLYNPFPTPSCLKAAPPRILLLSHEEARTTTTDALFTR